MTQGRYLIVISDDLGKDDFEKVECKMDDPCVSEVTMDDVVEDAAAVTEPSTDASGDDPGNAGTDASHEDAPGVTDASTDASEEDGENGAGLTDSGTGPSTEDALGVTEPSTDASGDDPGNAGMDASHEDAPGVTDRVTDPSTDAPEIALMQGFAEWLERHPMHQYCLLEMIDATKFFTEWSPCVSDPVVDFKKADIIQAMKVNAGSKSLKKLYEVEGDPAAALKPGSGQTFIINHAFVLFGYLHKLKCGDGITVAFVKQTSLVTHASNPKVGAFLSENFDVIVDSHDSKLYNLPEGGEGAGAGTEPERPIKKYSEMMRLLASEGRGIYPPCSVMSFFNNKLRRDRVLKPKQLPYVVLELSNEEGVENEETASWANFGSYIWKTLINERKGKNWNCLRFTEFMKSEGVILKPLQNFSAGTAVAILKVERDSSEVIVKVFDETEPETPKEWLQKFDGKVQLKAEPFDPEFQKCEYRLFLSLTSNKFHKLGMFETQMTESGDIRIVAYVGRKNKEADPKKDGKMGKLYYGKDIVPAKWKTVIDKNIKNRQQVLVEGVVYRCDMMVDESKSGKKSFVINEIQPLPSGSTFIKNGNEHWHLLEKMVDVFYVYLDKHWGKWPA